MACHWRVVAHCATTTLFRVARAICARLGLQIFTLDGQVLIDPLSLRDYDSFVTARGPVTVEVSLRS